MNRSGRLRMALRMGAVLLLSGARIAAATVYIPVPLEKLLLASDTVLVGLVRSLRVERHPSGLLETRVAVTVLQSVAGAPTPSEIEILSPGGAMGGEMEVVAGAPWFEPGQSYVLALRQLSGNAWRPIQLGAGVLPLVAAQLSSRGVGAERVRIRVPAAVEGVAPELRWEELARILQAVRSDLRDLTEPQLNAGGPVPRFQLARPLARLFEPDLGTPVAFFVDRRGDAALGAEESWRAVESGLRAWSGQEGASLSLELGGVASDLDLRCPDPGGQSFKILFDDPHGMIDPPLDCRGVLALTSYRAASTESKTFSQQTFSRIRCANVTFADGWGSCPEWSTCNVGEIAAHELGHAIGFAHSSERQPEPNDRLRLATMYVRAHFDGRCAALMADDLDGLRFLYPVDPPPSVLGGELLPPMTIGQPYEFSFSAIGGSPPYQWQLIRSDLCGLTLSDSGVLSGTVPACWCPTRSLPPSPTPAPPPYLMVQLADVAQRSHTRFFQAQVESGGATVVLPTCTPTLSPTASPTVAPSKAPTPSSSPNVGTVGPTPSPSSSPTREPTVCGTSGTSACASPTPTLSLVPSATPSPKPSDSPQPCAGDCDESGAVTIEELVRLVRIALGEEAIDRCPSGDRDGNGAITVDEIVAAVAVALYGCETRNAVQL